MKTITRIQTVLFGFILSSFMCAVCSAEVVSYRAVSVSNLNVREQPSVQSEKNWNYYKKRHCHSGVG